MKQLLTLLALLLLARPRGAEAAIAFDAAGGNNANFTTSLSISLTVGSGTHRKLICFVTEANGDQVTGLAWNGSETMSLSTGGKLHQDSLAYTYRYYLDTPTSGAHSVVVTLSGGDAASGICVAYSGMLAGDYDSVGTCGAAFGVTTLTCSSTVVAANSWQVFNASNVGHDPTASTGSTERNEQNFNGGGQWQAVYDSNGTVSTGSQSMSATMASGTAWGEITSWAPDTGGGGGSSAKNFMLLGVGP